MKAPFRYRRLAYVALNVTDLNRSIQFYRDLAGLMLQDTGADWAALRCSGDRQNVLLYRASHAGLKRVAFELESANDLESARAHVRALDVEIEEVDEEERATLQIENAFRFRLPGCGLCFEFLTGSKALEQPFEYRHAQIERLGHIVINVQAFDEVLTFLTEQLGFRISDQVPGFVAFLRCFPNPLHHSFAVLKDTTDHLNHVNFMVTDIDDIGRAINRMQKGNVEIVFGPGRHKPSESIFLYFLDPDRMTVEYSFGMETFPEVAAREPRTLDPTPETLDTWGSVPKPAFGKTGAIETASATS